MWLTNKQWPSRGSAWETSVTLTSVRRPEGERKDSLWMSGLREVPGKSRVLTHTEERHSPAQIGSPCSQIFSSLLPGGKKKRGKKVIQKKQKTKNITEQSGLDEERRREVRGGGVLYVWNRVESLEKKGRMLRTVAEEVRGISSRVPTLSLRGESRAQFFRYSSGAHKYLMSSHFNAKSCW